MFKAVVSTLTLSLTAIAAGPAWAMDFVGHAGSAGARPSTLALFAVALVMVAAITRAHRRYMTPRLTGGLITWAARQHGR
jgi:hypothetical protein